MTTFIVVLIIIITLGALLFFSNSIPALMEGKRGKDSNCYSNNILLTLSGICSFLVIVGFCLTCISISIQNEVIEKYQDSIKNINKYELIQEPVYRQIK